METVAIPNDINGNDGNSNKSCRGANHNPSYQYLKRYDVFVFARAVYQEILKFVSNKLRHMLYFIVLTCIALLVVVARYNMMRRSPKLVNFSQSSLDAIVIITGHDNNRPQHDAISSHWLQADSAISVKIQPKRQRKLFPFKKKKSQQLDDPSIFTHEQNWDKKIRCSQNKAQFQGQSIPVFWVNMDYAHRRRRIFEKQLERLRMKHQRISAVHPSSGVKYVRNISPQVAETPTELACLSSHLLAIYAAVYDTDLSPSSPYALIVEDDVVFEMDGA